MVDKLMYIPTDDTKKYPLSRLQFVVGTFDTQLIVPTNKNSANVLENDTIKLWGLE